jgi:hypothetical protein
MIDRPLVNLNFYHGGDKFPGGDGGMGVGAKGGGGGFLLLHLFKGGVL